MLPEGARTYNLISNSSHYIYIIYLYHITMTATVLLVGAGGVGTIAALNLETGGLASVTAVLRSNYTKVATDGFHIKSIDHGEIRNWTPSEGISPYLKLFSY